MRAKAYWLVALAAAAIIGVLVLYLRPTASDAPPGPSSAIPGARSNDSSSTRGTLPGQGENATKAANSSATQAPYIVTPLPPQNTKVKEVIAQLKEDADRGVPQAACRLGEELMRCWQVKQDLALRDQVLSRASTSTDAIRTALLAHAADMASSMQKDKDLCEGVSSEDANASWRYLLQAGSAGSLAAQAQFAINPPLSQEDVVGSLDGWNAYREYAAPFLHRSIEAGNIRALYFAFFATTTGMGPGGQAVGGKDPYRALVYAQALLPLVDPLSAQQIQGQLPALLSAVAGQATQAAQEGEALRAKYFGGKEPTDVSHHLGAINPGACAQ